MAEIRLKEGRVEDELQGRMDKEYDIQNDRVKVFRGIAEGLGPEWIEKSTDDAVTEKFRDAIVDPARTGWGAGWVNAGMITGLQMRDLVDSAHDLTPRGLRILRDVASYYETAPE